MCGLTGFWEARPERSADDLQGIIARMTARLEHRGPDDSGTWCQPAAGLALGHRRLSILDLSPAGHQPMASPCGRYHLVFNGEIFNFAELRNLLAATNFPFRGHSDTEVLLAGITHWGLAATLQRCIGMFALACWDDRERVLTLARDRLGIKPLYYGWQQSTFLFGSELHALRAHPACTATIDRQALAHYVRHGYIPAPASIFRGLFKLPPGTTLTLHSPGPARPAPVPFWNFSEVVQHGTQHPFLGTPQEATDELERLLTDAVRLRMIADVPLGAFLSGGIDSSLVVALMQRQSSRPVKTFTIGFHEPAYNEAPYARAVADHLHTEHTELYVTADEARDVIPKLPSIYDEPFADSSQIPTYLVSHLARQHVTVSLSGDGGDELFCGYRRYFDPLQTAGVLGRIPGPLKSAGGSMAAILSRVCPHPQGSRWFRRVANALGDQSPEDRYCRNLTHWPLDLVQGLQGQALSAESPLDHAPAPLNWLERRTSWPSFNTGWQPRWMWYDTLTYLPDDILTKVDRASMAVGLEARVPLLDHRVVEFAWKLPHAFKVRGHTGKAILRDVLARHVPPALFERPKVGFGVPLDQWLRGPLRDWAESLLDEQRLRRDGWFDPAPIRQRWLSHLAGTDWQYPLWPILMFQAWTDANP